MQEVTVNPGDTMWNIANKYLKDPQKWSEIVKANNMDSADPTIPISGSKLKIPVLLIKEEYRTAQLMSMIPDVRVKRRGDEAWVDGKQDMILKYEDSLRTMKGGQAKVKFPTKEVVQINENSYVVLKPEKILQEVQLLEGDIRASRAKVIMPNGTVVKPQTSQSDYSAKVREDKSEVVFVYKGEVNVTAQGKTVLVKQGFGTHVPKFAPPSAPMPLTDFKDFNPADMKVDAPKNPKIETKNDVFKFTPPAPAPEKQPAEGKSRSMVATNILTNYHLQVAKDGQFREIVLERTEKIGTPFDIKTQKIPDGNYYMRVAFLDALGVSGPYSAPAPVTRDIEPPEVANVLPNDGQKFSGPDSTCDVSGYVRGATTVSVNGTVVFLNPSGGFQQVVYLKVGPNKITVLASDLHGNKTTVERNVFYSK